jgi:branched chain amino acid efflux pump
MTDVWITVAALAVTTAAIRASGPVLVGGRDPHPRLFGVIALLAPALLAALVVTETFGWDGSLVVDERAAGVAAAGAALALRAPIIAVILIAAAVTALTRALA